MHPYHYTPDTCPEHSFGWNDGQPVDDHCSRCGCLWPPGDATEASAKEALRRTRESEGRISSPSGSAAPLIGGGRVPREPGGVSPPVSASSPIRTQCELPRGLYSGAALGSGNREP